jgi:predicted AlkP superfamily phosphohydrolase/phosphomutase
VSRTRQRVLALGLDAADRALVLDWARQGRLPVMNGLLREGSAVRLRSNGDLFPESIWPTITTGRSLGSHGVYNWRVVPPRQYALRWVRDGGGVPVWRTLRQQGEDLRALLVDIPYTVPLEDDGVTELIGWGQRGSALETSWPPGLMEAVRRRHGRYPAWTHVHFHRGAVGQRRLLRTLIRMAAVRTRVIAELMDERPWTFCMACYPEPHDGGHELYRYLDRNGWGYDRRRARGMEDGLLRLYRAVDTEVGKVVTAAGDDVNVLVFSGMGTRTNTSGHLLVRQLLVGLGYEVPAASQSAPSGPLGVLRARVPWSIRHFLHLRLSQQAREALMERFWLQATDWSRTRAYAEEEPGVGLVHLNVRGRDPEGIVAPGSEYRALCDEIAAELHALREAESGTPAVTEVLHRDEVVSGPRTEALPDLIVRFSQERLLGAVRHPRLGVIREQVRDAPYTEHSAEGFLLAAGPGIRQGAALEADLEDLAPTMLALMGVPVPAGIDGEPLGALLR